MDKNQKNKILKLLTDIKSVLEPFNMFEDDMDEYERPFKTFDNVVVKGMDDIVLFERAIDDIWRFDSEIFYNYSRKSIIKLVLKFIFVADPVNNENLIKWIKDIKAKESKDYWIFKEIRGAELSNKEPIQFGLFHVVDRILHKDYIISKTQLNRNQWNEIWQKSEETLMIGINIQVKELARGYELTEKYFSQFENIIKYVAPTSSSNTQVDIINKPESYIDYIYTLYPKGYRKKGDLKDYKLSNIDLNHPAFFNPVNGTEYLFSLITKTKLNEIQERILKSVDWIGKGLREKDKCKGFVQIMFGLESLLNSQENEIIQPSILSKMSENIAFTMGHTYEDRIRLDKEFKKLYGIRSSIAHGRQDIFSEGDFLILINISRLIIREFLTNNDLISISTFNKYLDWIKVKKYGTQ